MKRPNKIDKNETGVALVFLGLLMLLLSCSTNIYLIGVNDKDWQIFFQFTAAILTTLGVGSLIVGSLIYRKGDQ